LNSTVSPKLKREGVPGKNSFSSNSYISPKQMFAGDQQDLAQEWGPGENCEDVRPGHARSRELAQALDILDLFARIWHTFKHCRKKSDPRIHDPKLSFFRHPVLGELSIFFVLQNLGFCPNQGGGGWTDSQLFFLRNLQKKRTLWKEFETAATSVVHMKCQKSEIFHEKK